MFSWFSLHAYAESAYEGASEEDDALVLLEAQGTMHCLPVHVVDRVSEANSVQARAEPY